MEAKKIQARALVLCVLVSLLIAVPAFAAGGGDGESPSLFSGDLGNAVWTSVVFLGLLFVLGKFAWNPVLDGLQAREDFIRNSLEEAKKDRESAEGRLKEYEERLNEAHAQATAIVEEGHRDAEVTAARIKEEAQAEAEKMIQRAKREIELAGEAALKEFFERSGKLATEMASRIVEREINADDHTKLIEQAIEEIGRSETAN